MEVPQKFQELVNTMNINHLAKKLMLVAFLFVFLYNKKKTMELGYSYRKMKAGLS